MREDTGGRVSLSTPCHVYRQRRPFNPGHVDGGQRLCAMDHRQNKGWTDTWLVVCSMGPLPCHKSSFRAHRACSTRTTLVVPAPCHPVCLRKAHTTCFDCKLESPKTIGNACGKIVYSLIVACVGQAKKRKSGGVDVGVATEVYPGWWLGGKPDSKQLPDPTESCQLSSFTSSQALASSRVSIKNGSALTPALWQHA